MDLALFLSRKPHATLIVSGDFNQKNSAILSFMYDIAPCNITYRRDVLGKMRESPKQTGCLLQKS